MMNWLGGLVSWDPGVASALCEAQRMLDEGAGKFACASRRTKRVLVSSGGSMATSDDSMVSAARTAVPVRRFSRARITCVSVIVPGGGEGTSVLFAEADGLVGLRKPGFSVRIFETSTS